MLNVPSESISSHVHAQQDLQEIQKSNVFEFQLLVLQISTVLLENLALTQRVCLFAVPIKNVH
jgi:hypothetical protein